MTPEVALDPRILAALIGGLVVAMGWVIASWRERGATRRTRLQREADLRIALGAEIEAHVKALRFFDLEERWRRIVLRMEDDADYVAPDSDHPRQRDLHRPDRRGAGAAAERHRAHGALLHPAAGDRGHGDGHALGRVPTPAQDRRIASTPTTSPSRWRRASWASWRSPRCGTGPRPVEGSRSTASTSGGGTACPSLEAGPGLAIGTRMRARGRGDDARARAPR